MSTVVEQLEASIELDKIQKAIVEVLGARAVILKDSYVREKLKELWDRAQDIKNILSQINPCRL